MLRRIICLAIIMSMILHCASRLGFVSYLYKNRHDIAYTVGLIAEVPIAMCSSDYHFEHELVIQDVAADDELPLSLTHVQEITLFAPAITFSFSSVRTILETEAQSPYQSYNSSPSIADIFHPPSFA